MNISNIEEINYKRKIDKNKIIDELHLTNDNDIIKYKNLIRKILFHKNAIKDYIFDSPLSNKFNDVQINIVCSNKSIFIDSLNSDIPILNNNNGNSFNEYIHPMYNVPSDHVINSSIISDNLTVTDKKSKENVQCSCVVC